MGSPVTRSRDGDNPDWCGGRGDGEKWPDSRGSQKMKLSDGSDVWGREQGSDVTAELGWGNLTWLVALELDDGLLRACQPR